MITECRVCKGTLTPVLNLGNQSLTGIFPKPGEDETYGPLELVSCDDCTLVQLRHTFDLEKMYGDSYGYRSGLNRSMVDHLTRKAKHLEQYLKDGDTVLDIGSNDGTLLKAYTKELFRVGIDPTADKFREYYPAGVEVTSTFFSAPAYRRSWRAKPKVVTSVAMFYDLPDPVDFARNVFAILADDGVWHIEASYLPDMVKACAYDTVCHEHIEYYSLKSIAYIINKAGGSIQNVSFNDTNGASFAIDVRKGGHNWPEVDKLIAAENTGIDGFDETVSAHAANLVKLVHKLNREGAVIHGYGASTKGNVLLQYCGFDEVDIPCIVEVNDDKFGCVTPGTHIPIVPEEEAVPPDYYLVLPWHFKDGIVKNNQEYLEAGGQFIFPMPEIEVVGRI